MFAASTRMPSGVGSIDGVGHITNRRLVLSWDVEGALKRKAVRGDMCVIVAYFPIDPPTDWNTASATENLGHKLVCGVIKVASKISSRRHGYWAPQCSYNFTPQARAYQTSTLLVRVSINFNCRQRLDISLQLRGCLIFQHFSSPA